MPFKKNHKVLQCIRSRKALIVLCQASTKGACIDLDNLAYIISNKFYVFEVFKKYLFIITNTIQRCVMILKFTFFLSNEYK